jgi:hypothetical protein
MYIEALDAAEALEIQNQKIAAEAVAEFKTKHRDFDDLFPGGVTFTFVGDGIVTKHEILDRLRKKRSYEKRRKAFHDEVRAQNAAAHDLISAGWRPPRTEGSGKVDRRFKLDKQPDGSVIVDELDTN